MQVLFSIVISFATLVTASADEFVYRDETGSKQTLEARLLGTGQGFHVLERSDGQLQIIPVAALEDRMPAEGPVPFDAAQMIQLLSDRFGSENVRTTVQEPFLVGLVLAAPIDRAAEGRVTTLLKKAARFMKNVDTVFSRFARSMRIPLDDPRFPLVLLIFESDEDFEAYADEATGGRGLSAAGIAGFYSGLTNWLAVRLSSCDTFEVPLHEAIHQQMYNRVFQRLAPVPKWFDEGIATGFESSGDRIDVHPARVNSRYARQIQRLSGAIDWAQIIENDGGFTADVLAGDAYTLAWALHWMLVTQHRDAYRDYVTKLSQRKPLEQISESQRVSNFESTFGTTIAELQSDFPRALQSNLRRQKIDLNDPLPAGLTVQQQQLGEVQLSAISRLDRGGALQVEGMLKNVSPFRDLCFYIIVETDSGLYADWMIPRLSAGRSMKLDTQYATKRAAGARGGPSRTFRVQIRSTAVDGREAQQWKAGNVPAP